MSGWVRFGDQLKGGAKQEKQGEQPILEDFLAPVSAAGFGLHAKMLYNDYVYFWRWALWRLFEKQKCGGIVTFITASSYLAGPGFVGMREVMRRTFDDIWIIDLGGDNLGTRKTPNVFNIQTPVAIAIGIRTTTASPNVPAAVRYAKIEGGTREDKLAFADGFAEFGAIVWQDCPTGWQKPFLPAGNGDFFDFPRLEDIFPYTFPGVQTGRNWIIGETEDLLISRLEIFVKGGKKSADFKESRDTKIKSVKRDITSNKKLKSISAWLSYKE